MARRSFLDFRFSENCDDSNGITTNGFDIPVRVFTDFNGGFEFLAEIPFREFAKRIGRHVEVAENDSELGIEISEDGKLLTLSELWRDISPEIGGYLFGDTRESNPDPRNSLTCTCANSISDCPRHD
jgi:hypothetical protein